jgi:hypothetical protein
MQLQEPHEIDMPFCTMRIRIGLNFWVFVVNDCKKTPISNQFEPHGLQKNIYSAIIPSWINLHLPFQAPAIAFTDYGTEVEYHKVKG